MRQLQRRVQRDLDRIADQAPISSESWQQLRQRIAAEPDRIDEEVIMLAPAEPTSTRPRRATAIAFAFTAVVAVAIAGLIALWVDDDSDTLTVEDGPTTVTDGFDPAVDDLCGWVTGDDIVAHLTAAGADVEGPATPTEPAPDDPMGWDCEWVLASGEEIQLGARTIWPRPDYDLADADDPMYYGYVEYDEPGQIMEPGAYIIGHPDVGDDVAVKNEGFLRFSLYPLGSDHELNIMYFFQDYWECDDSETCNQEGLRYETVVMGTAGAVLQDLQWVEPTTSLEEDQTAVTAVDWQYGSSLRGELAHVATWSDGLAAIMDLDGDETPTGGEVWYSTDGVDWAPEPDPFGPDGNVYMLAGQNGDLFALAGDPDDSETPQTLWHRGAGERWEEVMASEAIDHMAVGPDRLIAYGEGGFDIVGVFDTANLEPAEFDRLPGIDAISTDPATGEPFEPEVLDGHAIALDEGFLADVTWITGADDGGAVREERLMYSADGSTWIEHPNPPDRTLVLPSWAATPVFDGLNLLSLPNQVDSAPWITDDGLSFIAATDPGLNGPTANDAGFFTVDGGNRIHRSIDGITWEVLQSPPTWPYPQAVADEGEVQHGSIHTHDDRMLAIGTRGDFEGWVGIVDPTTEIWFADR